MGELGRYTQITEFSNQDAGNCQWCYATRDGKEYFIKNFLSPKYPVNEKMMSPEKAAKRKAKCAAFERKKIRVYSELNKYSDGNAVRIEEFFREGPQYYAVMPRVVGNPIEIDDIAKYPEPQKRQLCAVISHALAAIHNAGFVHADIKHTNILFPTTRNGKVTAKIIDYDAGYMEDSPPSNSEEIGGDPVYLAPETIAAIYGESVRLTRKLDIFALGILFHQYYTGDLPQFDRVENSCVGEAVSKGNSVHVSDFIPADARRLIIRMLSANPEQRPDAIEVYSALSRPAGSAGADTKTEPPKAVKKVWFKTITEF